MSSGIRLCLHAALLGLPVATMLADRPCPCGGRGHVEAIASGPALLAEYRRRTTTEVAHLADVACLAAQGDHIAASVLTEGAAALGSAVGGLINVVDPEIVVIGGGVAGSGALWWRALREAVAAQVLPALRHVPIEPSALGSNAPLVGAARMALEKAA
jgi:glucokinase